MNRKKPLIAVAVLVLAGGGFAAWRLLSGGGEEAGLSGYIEGETLYLASPVAGNLSSVTVRRGQRVEAGSPLFVIEPDQLAAQQARSAAELAAAKAQAEDVRKGQRPVELAVLQADLAAAQAVSRAAQAELGRTRTLVEKGIFAQARLDDVRGQADAAAAQVRAAQRRLDVARQAARPDQIEAADARVRQAQAGLAETNARLFDLAPRAPGPARVEEVFLQPGEWAAPNQPVLALIPDDRVFVRFFVPETEVAKYPIGRPIGFSCDGCAKGLKATVSYVSPRPEFTPPVIYSRGSRERLVFMVEAEPERPRDLAPGLPVDVERP